MTKRWIDVAGVIVGCAGFVSSTGVVVGWLVGAPYGWMLLSTVLCAITLYVLNHERTRRDDPYRLMRKTDEWKEFQEAMEELKRVTGKAVHGPLSRMADALSELANKFAPPGTVQNPRTDDTTPRELSHVQRFGSRFPR